jgi:hypothetical protein
VVFPSSWLPPAVHAALPRRRPHDLNCVSKLVPGVIDVLVPQTDEKPAMRIFGTKQVTQPLAVLAMSAAVCGRLEQVIGEGVAFPEAIARPWA